MAMRKLKSGDTVLVLAGKDKGAKGKILKVITKANKALVEGVNLIKKHVKRNPQTNEGGIIEKEAPIALSNLAIFNPATNKGDRVGFKVLENGKKVRYFKSNNEIIDV